MLQTVTLKCTVKELFLCRLQKFTRKCTLQISVCKCSPQTFYP